MTSPRWLLVLIAILPLPLCAQDAPPAPDAALVERAGKIVAALELADPAQAARIRDVVAGQYAVLRPVHDARDAAIQAAKARPEKAAVDAATQAARDTAAARQAELHYAFLARLAVELSPDQV